MLKFIISLDLWGKANTHQRFRDSFSNCNSWQSELLRLRFQAGASGLDELSSWEGLWEEEQVWEGADEISFKYVQFQVPLGHLRGGILETGVHMDKQQSALFWTPLAPYLDLHGLGCLLPCSTLGAPWSQDKGLLHLCIPFWVPSTVLYTLIALEVCLVWRNFIEFLIGWFLLLGL